MAPSPVISNYVGNQIVQTTTIPNGTKESGVIALAGYGLIGILFPAAFTSTTLTFEASYDGTTFFPVVTGTGGSALSYTVAQGTYAAIDPKDFQGIPFLKLKGGTNEGADRVLSFSLKGI